MSLPGLSFTGEKPHLSQPGRSWGEAAGAERSAEGFRILTRPVLGTSTSSVCCCDEGNKSEGRSVTRSCGPIRAAGSLEALITLACVPLAANLFGSRNGTALPGIQTLFTTHWEIIPNSRREMCP